jgi:hypothetical protein
METKIVAEGLHLQKRSKFSDHDERYISDFLNVAMFGKSFLLGGDSHQ